VLYVWGLYQGVHEGAEKTVDIPQEESKSATPEAVPESVPEENQVTQLISEEPSEPITIDVGTLSDSQRAILETFGFSSDEITVSDALIQCAKNAVGETRFLEIINGAAPTPFEALALVPCAKK
jgi:hypothetical protein